MMIIAIGEGHAWNVLCGLLLCRQRQRLNSVQESRVKVAYLALNAS